MNPPVGIVAGSGLDLVPLLSSVTQVLPFSNVSGLVRPGVVGHAGEYLVGTCAGHHVILQRGRLHLYEGYSVDDVVRPVDTLASLGARTIIFTNATGGLLPQSQAGQLVSIRRVRVWPCDHWRSAPSFVEPTDVLQGCDLSGEYVWVHGPCYETRAEIEAMRRLGGAVVGMSTALELYRCQQLGLRSAVVSCITNVCGQTDVLTHNEVLTNAYASSAKLVEVLRHVIATLTPEITAQASSENTSAVNR